MRLRGPGIALTLDACPGGFDMRIAAALIETGTPATIMLTGAWLRRNPEGLALMLVHPALFGFGNHGEQHLAPVLGSRRIFGQPVAGTLAAIGREVSEGAASIRRATGAAPGWYRGATAYYSPAAVPVIQGLGVSIAGFSLSADQGASLPAGMVAARMGRARDGEVIIAHINQPSRASGQGVADGIRALHRAGGRFVRLDELGEVDAITKSEQ